MKSLLAFGVFSWSLLVGLAGFAVSEVIDDFSSAEPWEIVASEGVDVKVSVVADPRVGDEHKTVLRVDIHFVTGGGFGGIRRNMPQDLPANFELAFSIRGDLPPNNLELKLADMSGDNVWWVNRRRFEFPQDWKKVVSRRRHFEFAWGPSNKPLTRTRSIEIVFASAEGGRGTIYLDDLSFREVSETKPYTGTPQLTASSNSGDLSLAKAAMDGDLKTAWQSKSDDVAPQLTIDFGVAQTYGGLMLDWDPEQLPESYSVELSDDGKQWSQARLVTAGSARQFLAIPDAEARAMRLSIKASAGKTVALRELEILPLEVSKDENTFAAEVARRMPRGHYPRATCDEGTFWTIIGVPWGEREALISEDGALEVDKRSFSIEPFLWQNGKLHTWADAKTAQSLAEDCVPVPTVTRSYDELDLSVTAFANGEVGSSTLWALYEVTNTSNEPVEGSLLLALRPFQVNPPYQWLNTMGGVSKVQRIELGEIKKQVIVDDKQITLGKEPDGFGATTSDAGDISTFLSRQQLPPYSSVDDPQRSASAAVEYRFKLEPGKSESWVLAVPFEPGWQNVSAALALQESVDPVKMVEEAREANIAEWLRIISTFDLLLPADRQDIHNTIRSTLAHIVINADGKAIHPGSRSYERSWIRDGSLTATALLRFGVLEPAREFVDWYAPYQFESGKVPCVVDNRGPDPVSENDSHGQLIMAIMNVYRFSGDKAFLEKHVPHVEKAVAYIEKIRAERMTPEYADPQTTATRQELNKPAVSLHAFYGLVPESISHEGYSAKPMHSYWDDFFVLKGLKDAAEMMRVLGRTEQAERYQKVADDFATTLYKSMEAAQKAHGIDYIPGCVEFGDFDATSTTIALWPCGEAHRLPREALERTFERYWERFVQRRDNPDFDWFDYTPYEVRVIGSLNLLDQTDRAQEAMEFFLKDRRPTAWNQWPEVIYRKPRTARFLGDLPHTWCGSDFINSVRMMFLYEREHDDALVLFSGVPESWVSTEAIGFRDMPTYFGRITCTLSRDKKKEKLLTAELSGSCPVPSGGIRLTCPLGKVQQAKVNGQPATLDAEGRVQIDSLPARVELTL
jgi:hypothetical protein